MSLGSRDENGYHTSLAFLQVNGQNMERWTHETAAKALKTAGNKVTLKVIYKPEGE